MPNYVYLGFARCKQNRLQRFPWHSRERAITNEQVFLKVSEKEFGGFPSGHLHIKASRDVSACIFIRGGQEREGKKFCERPSWLPKNFSLVTSIPPASQRVWFVHAGLSVLYGVFPQVNLSRRVGPTRTQSGIFTVESKKKKKKMCRKTAGDKFPPFFFFPR